MSVVGTPTSGVFTRYRGVKRGIGQGGPVGTWMVDAGATGDSGGGSVKVNVQMEDIDFGFGAIVVPTLIGTRDSLVAAENVLIVFTTANERIHTGGIEDHIIQTRIGSQNRGSLDKVNVALSVDGPGPGTVMIAEWDTNTDTKEYHLHVYGVVYDEEAMARLANDLVISGALAGIS